MLVLHLCSSDELNYNNLFFLTVELLSVCLTETRQGEKEGRGQRWNYPDSLGFPLKKCPVWTSCRPNNRTPTHRLRSRSEEKQIQRLPVNVSVLNLSHRLFSCSDLTEEEGCFEKRKPPKTETFILFSCFSHETQTRRPLSSSHRSQHAQPVEVCIPNPVRSCLKEFFLPALSESWLILKTA